MEDNLGQSGNGAMQGAAASAFGIASQQREEDEEIPSMRAVSIMSQPATLQVTNPGKYSGTKSNGFGRPEVIRATHGRSMSAGVSMKNEWNECNWKINNTLDQVPLGFPIERTHREIHGVDATEVARRISNALRDMSIETDFDNVHAKAKCTSLDQVSFRVRLFAGSEDGTPVIAEVQRRHGSPSSFMKICRQILDGAEGTLGPGCPLRKNMPSFTPGSIGKLKCLQSVAKIDEGKAELDALNKSIELLKSPEKTAHLLGLQNLCFLTDPLKTAPNVALSSSKKIIQDEYCGELRELVCAILQTEELLPEQTSAAPLEKRTRHTALLLLSNALLLTSSNGSLASAVESQNWIADSLIPLLVDFVQEFEESSNNAYEAACCLTSVASCSDVAKEIVKKHSAILSLQAAHNFGKNHHALLAGESERTLNALGASVN